MPSHDVINEAKHRDAFKESSAFGEHKGNKIALFLDTNKYGTPRVYTRFNFDFFENDDIPNEFLGGTRQEKTFAQARKAKWYFDEVVTDWGLQEEIPPYW